MYKDADKQRASNLMHVKAYRRLHGNSWWKWNTRPAEYMTPDMRRMAMYYQADKHARLAAERRALRRPHREDYQSEEAYLKDLKDYDRMYHRLSVRMFYCRQRIRMHRDVLYSLGEDVPDVGLDL